MGLTSELLEVAIESDSQESTPDAPALWLGWFIILVLVALAILLVRFLYRRIKSIGSRLKK